MRNRWGLWLVLGSAWSTAALAQAGPAWIEIHGHRGAPVALPENSLPSFAHALEVGADYLEMDLRVTADGEVIVHHDAAIDRKRCLGPGGARLRKDPRIAGLTLAELRGYDCGSLPDPDFPTQRPVPGTGIPTFGEVLALLNSSDLPRARTAGIHIELKTPSRLGPEAFAERVLAVARDHGFLDRIVIQSVDVRYSRAADRMAVRMGGKARPKVVSPPLFLMKGVIGRLIFRYLKSLGYKVVPWTVNKPADWRKLVRLGVDGIITDDPAGLARYLGR